MRIKNGMAPVSEMDEFLNLEAKEVERWISSDEISVAAEADVFKIVLKWIEQNNSERKQSFERLFDHVRLPSLSRDFLIDVVTNELVQGSSRCLWLVLDSIKVMAFPVEGSLPQSPRKCLETRAIVCCGGKYTLCYLPEKDEWKRLADGLTEKINSNTQMMNYRDQLYAVPRTGKAERYDPVFNCWSTLDMSTTSSTKVAVVRGEIYAIEVCTSKKTSSVKRYDVVGCSWLTVSSSHEGCREGSCVIAAGNQLYVCGGRSGISYYDRDYLAKAERFHTVENKWETIADMQQKRGFAFGATTGGKIFVPGGNPSPLSCEMYNISTNEWQVIGRMNDEHSCGSMVCFKGTLYVLGGTSIYGRGYLKVECYDPIENNWIQKTTIPVKMISEDNKDRFSGCVLKLSKGVLNKLDIIKDSKKEDHRPLS